MTAIQIMERCKAAEGDKQKLRDRIARYRDSATRATAAMDGIGSRSTSESDKLAAIVAEIDELERAIRQRDREYAAELAAACKLLDMLPETECKIADEYYVRGKTLLAISHEMKYSYGYIRTAHSQARQHLYAIPDGMVAALLPAWYKQLKR